VNNTVAGKGNWLCDILSCALFSLTLVMTDFRDGLLQLMKGENYLPWYLALLFSKSLGINIFFGFLNMDGSLRVDLPPPKPKDSWVS
jgi:hypothetical protein